MERLGRGLRLTIPLMVKLLDGLREHPPSIGCGVVLGFEQDESCSQALSEEEREQLRRKQERDDRHLRALTRLLLYGRAYLAWNKLPDPPMPSDPRDAAIFEEMYQPVLEATGDGRTRRRVPRWRDCVDQVRTYSVQAAIELLGASYGSGVVAFAERVGSEDVSEIRRVFEGRDVRLTDTPSASDAC